MSPPNTGATTQATHDPEILERSPLADTGNRLHKGRPKPIRTQGLIDQDSHPTSSPKTPRSAPPSKTPRSAQGGAGHDLKRGSRVSSMFNFNKSTSPKVIGSWKDTGNPLHSAKAHPYSTALWKREYYQALRIEDIMIHGEIEVSSPATKALGHVNHKRQYAVLMAHQLIRFKSKLQASQWIPSLKVVDFEESSLQMVRSKSSLVGDSASISANDIFVIDLTQVVSVYNLDDGRPYFTIDIAGLESRLGEGPSSWVVTMHIEEPQVFESWLHCLRDACAHAAQERGWDDESILFTHATKMMHQDSLTYSSNVFGVVQRMCPEDCQDALTKHTTSICLMVVGRHRLHIIPLPKVNTSSSMQSSKGTLGKSHGLMCLTNFRSQIFDQTFHIHFRLPLQKKAKYVFSSSDVSIIMNRIWQAVRDLRPTWQDLPFDWTTPTPPDELEPSDLHDLEKFSRTLDAYCDAYGDSSSVIMWHVDETVEDSPRFMLQSLSGPHSRPYRTGELLAVLRALRYNQYFVSVSFAGVDLSALQRADVNGSEHELWRTCGGQYIGVPTESEVPFSLLVLEIRALLLTSRRLRRMDFSGCLSPSSYDASHMHDCRGSLLEAILPLCEKQVTNVDWLCLNKINLSRNDMDFLHNAAMQKACHFRAVELSNCALDDQDLKNILDSLGAQGNTLESLNISANPALLDTPVLVDRLKPFRHLCRLDLLNLVVRNTALPLLPFELLSTWRLEFLQLSGIGLNASSLQHLARYFETPNSLCLTWLGLNGCRLTGGDIGRLLRALHHGQPGRSLCFEASRNHLEAGGEHAYLVNAIQQSETPVRMALENYEYREGIAYRRLIQALAENTTLTTLSISGVAPRHIDRNDEGPFEAMATSLAENTTLKVLNISGEVGHVDATNMGVKLGFALRGLERNHSLVELTVENQGFGFAGAGALARTIGRNRSLRTLRFDNNDINLQGFTTIVNAVEDNDVLLEVSALDNDRARDLRRLSEEENSVSTSSSLISKKNLTKTMKRAMKDQNPFASKSNRKSMGSENLSKVVEMMDEKWEEQRARLQSFLERNQRIMLGSTPISDEDEVREKLILASPRTEGTSVQKGSSAPIGAGGLDKELEAKAGELHLTRGT